MNIDIEKYEDYREVENLTREAFWNIYHPGCTEHFVLNKYRTNPDFIPELDFVMKEHGRIIGHVMYSKAHLFDDKGNIINLYDKEEKSKGKTDYEIMTFGPISIHPDYKRKGYGLKLLQYSLEKAKEMGCKFICMEGNIDFYKKAGFVVASTLKIHYYGEPKESDVPYFLAQELVPGFLRNIPCYKDGIEPTYHTPKGYFIADANPDDFAAYDTTFPQKEKHLMEGQLPQFCKICGMPMNNDALCGKNADGSINFDYCSSCY